MKSAQLIFTTTSLILINEQSPII